MYIVHVTPIGRNIGKDSLSYFTFKDIPIGSIVNVPIRKSEAPALVLDKEDANAIKSLLRTRGYSTKNIKDPNPVQLVSEEFVAAARETANHFATTIGNVFNSFLPAAILKHEQQDSTALSIEINLNSQKRKNSYEMLTIQSAKKERETSYKTILRGALARGESTLICVPNAHEAEKMKSLYSKGIDKYVFVLHSNMPAKEQRKVWHKILAEVHPVLIIATRSFLSIPRKDLGVILVDSEGSNTYIGVTKPFIDTRVFVKKLAKQLGIKLIFADTVLTMCTHKSLVEHDAMEFERASKRLRTKVKTSTVDMSKYTLKAKEERKQYPILSQEAQKEIKKLKGRMFILASRRGVASQTVCGDCGIVVSCSRCSAPMVLHGKASDRYFLCHRCGENEDSKRVCTNCSGWRLNPLGIGIERVEEAVREATDIPILRIDSDSTKTTKKLGEVVTKFNNTEKCILIGTTMALPYLHANIGTSIVASFDALLSTQNFSAEEQTFRMLLKLQEQTSANLLIQTRTPNSKILKSVKTGEVSNFVKSELELRKKFKYPPYATFIKISITGSQDYTTREMKKLINVLRDYGPRVFHGFIPEKSGRFTLNALLRYSSTNSEHWPDEKLLSILHSLPSSFVVQIT